MQCIKFFNKYKVFISYDPLTFLSIMAALCGCISIIYKIDGLNKKEWINTTVVAEYLKYSGEELYGIAYGANDIQHAIDTLHLVKQQWNNIQKYTQEKTVLPFIEDMQNFEKMENTIQNNYFI